MIEDWIDNLCKVWEISNGGFGTVISHKLINQNNFPDSIDPSELDKQPIALSIPATVQPKYSMGNKHLTWFGVTEFHVSPDISRARIPGLMAWYGRILRAAAGSVQLNGTVGNFVIVDRTDGIAGPLKMQYGSEALHWGFIVNWMVEESPDSVSLPVSA